MLLMFVPFLNLALAIYVLFFQGSAGSNRFGPAPVENTSGVKIFAIVIPIIAIFVIGILTAT